MKIEFRESDFCISLADSLSEKGHLFPPFFACVLLMKKIELVEEIYK